jgi:16S rRNA (guanine527-N7)-methyltransferase
VKQFPPSMVDCLREACADLDLTLSDETLEAMAAHWDLVCRWNARTNLTAIVDDPRAATLHYRDSLAALELINSGPIVDFGSGAGFPGIPLALARPDWLITLVEPRRKRASFLEMAVARLNLRNVKVRVGRLEDTPDQLYRHAVTRATFSDEAAFEKASRWLEPQGSLLAYRSDSGESSARVHSQHRYKVANSARVIEVWTFGG